MLRRLAHPDATTRPRRAAARRRRPGARAAAAAGRRARRPASRSRLHAGDDADLDDVVERLAAAAYTRVDLVEQRGEFAVRGGILDVFPPTEEHPLRVEFWGDTVEEIRWFKVADQRSLEVAEHGLWAPPCRELLLDRRRSGRGPPRSPTSRPGRAGRGPRQARRGHRRRGHGVAGPGAGPTAWSCCSTSCRPATHVVVLCDPERVRTRAHDLVAHQPGVPRGVLGERRGRRRRPDRPRRRGLPLARRRPRRTRLDRGPAVVDARRRSGRTPSSPTSTREAFGGAEVLAARRPRRRRSTAATPPGRSPTSGGWLARRLAGRRSSPRATARRSGWSRCCGEAGVAARLDADLTAAPGPARSCTWPPGSLEHGFVAPGLRLLVLTETDLAGQRSSTKDMRRMPSRRRNVVDPLQLKPGDYVVHEQHGVGRYVEMVQRTVAGRHPRVPRRRVRPGQARPARRPALRARPTSSTRSPGTSAARRRRLHRLGGADWAKTKGRARKAVREIAAELIRLYSARMAVARARLRPGHAVAARARGRLPLRRDARPARRASTRSRPTWSSSVPMDRLICGDVGYGKTEIAVRAAFKAVQDGKQVAVLVPTTLLVQQHFVDVHRALRAASRSWCARCRASSPTARPQTVLDGLADGTVDVVIGTHRLLSPEVRFKDLGLVIVDEEQRFGVEHKEHLKQLRTHVDVLTHVGDADPAHAGDGGHRHPRDVDDPDPAGGAAPGAHLRRRRTTTSRSPPRSGASCCATARSSSSTTGSSRSSRPPPGCASWCPRRGSRSAHGQMNEDAARADHRRLLGEGVRRPGLHDDRRDRPRHPQRQHADRRAGRHVRARRSCTSCAAGSAAAASGPTPTSSTRRRSRSPRPRTTGWPRSPQHTDLGAGMHVAMKDLEIRGAGNLLGGEQSGHIAGVGFDLYVRLVGEAVAEFRGEAGRGGSPRSGSSCRSTRTCRTTTCRGERLRLEAYRKIAEAAGEPELDSRSAPSCVDRYGAAAARRSRTCSRSRGFRVLARGAGLTERRRAGQPRSGSPRSTCRSRSQLRLTAALPGHAGQGRGPYDPGAAPEDRPGRRAAAARRRAARLVPRAGRVPCCWRTPGPRPRGPIRRGRRERHHLPCPRGRSAVAALAVRGGAGGARADRRATRCSRAPRPSSGTERITETEVNTAARRGAREAQHGGRRAAAHRRPRADAPPAGRAGRPPRCSTSWPPRTTSRSTRGRDPGRSSGSAGRAEAWEASLVERGLSPEQASEFARHPGARSTRSAQADRPGRPACSRSAPQAAAPAARRSGSRSAPATASSTTASRSTVAAAADDAVAADGRRRGA